MSERKLHRLELIRERHRKLILKPKREAELFLPDRWDDEPESWPDEYYFALARAGRDDE